MTRATVRRIAGLHKHFRLLVSPSSSQYRSTEQEERRRPQTGQKDSADFLNATQQCAELLLSSSRPKTPGHPIACAFSPLVRSANYTKPGQYVKCFHNPEKVLILHNHFPLGCLGGVCTSNPVNTTMAQVQSSPCLPCELYRVSHVLVDLGCVDFGLGVPPTLPSSPVASAKFPSGRIGQTVEHLKFESTQPSPRAHGMPCRIGPVIFGASIYREPQKNFS